MRLRVLCPAKVNSFLSVGPPDASGFHPIRTVFRAVGLFDELIVELSDRREIVCDWPGLPEDNTITRAIRYASELLTVPPLRITLRKRIPPQSGLGGGSSNAAGLIRALRRLLGGAIGERQAFEVARGVGKDVPFFLVGGVARGQGYGDRLTPLPDEPRRWLVLAKPGVGCDTADAYGRLDAISREWRPFPTVDEYYNDFQAVAPDECLAILRRLERLGASNALLCGSGSATFGVFEEREAAVRAAEALEGEEAPWVEVAPTLSRAESLEIEDLG